MTSIRSCASQVLAVVANRICECAWVDRRMVLRSVYYACRRNNWITWFVPSARVWTHRGSISVCVGRRLPGDSDDASLGRFLRAAGALPEAFAGRRAA